MARIVYIDTDTSIGYNFVEKYFYVVNKDTYTTRLTATKIKDVLDIVAPDNTMTVSDIQALEDTPEALNTVRYTWSDEGDYIKTIELNHYSEHPITIDLKTSKLYIMNTELIFDLTLNESADYRTEYIASYYKKYLGFGQEYIDQDTHELVDVFRNQIKILYDFLISFYSPTVYNQIDSISISKAKSDSTSPLKYNNKFGLTNYNNTSPATYMCTLNPNSQFTPSTTSYYIGVMQADTGIIGLYTPNNTFPEELTPSTQVVIANSTQTYLDTSYTNDGVYTITNIDTNPDKLTVTLDRQLVLDYTCPYYTAYLTTDFTNISSVSRTNSTITLTSACPQTIQTGSTIYIKGSTRTISNQTTTLDGAYTVTSLDNVRTTVTVTPTPAFDLTSAQVTSSAEFQIYRSTILSPVLYIADNIVYLMNDITPLTQTPFYIQVRDIEGNIVEWFPSNTASTVNTITSSLPITNYFPNYPTISRNLDVDTIEINTLTTSDKGNFPTTKFNVDTFAQCQAYINTLEGLQVPSISIRSNVGQSIPPTITLEGIGTMYSLGVYSMVYADN